MNNALELKGKRFEQSKKNSSGGGPAMNRKQSPVTNTHVLKLLGDLDMVKRFWQIEEKFFEGILVSVVYNKIVAKSNRIAGLLKGAESNFAIVGAKFTENQSGHIITYYMEQKYLDKSLVLIKKVSEILKAEFSGAITKEQFDDKAIMNRISVKKYGMSKSQFKQIIADISYIDGFDVDTLKFQTEQSIVTLYDTGVDIKTLCSNIGINIMSNRILDKHTIVLDESEMKKLYEKVPYLVSMATVDLADLSPDEFTKEYKDGLMHIPNPSIEPVIGVIDTLFDKRVYFGEWVEYFEMVDERIKSQHDFVHGTAVSSIIVDGPRLNPWLDDGCGRFRVRHFGVAAGSKFSSVTIMRQIKSIVMDNLDIKVWNISLGSNQEINDNFISAEAALLDKIQYENDIIFVIAGTNKPNDSVNKIGSPADSVNSIVVNSVTKEGLSTSYSRKGLVLSFFAKPDVSYYGGSREEYINVCEPLGAAKVAGTSFAAPWIARKLAYLINVLGLSREVAKALVIDAARGWNAGLTPEEVALYGNGVVPIRIDDIIKTNEDEIKFLVSDISEKWNTYNFYFPVPIKNDKYPFVARATMCYFPLCERTQGVDYTNTELNLQFGRIKDDQTILDIKGDRQNSDDSSVDGAIYILEGEAREKFRKWDNVKYKAEVLKNRSTSKKSYTNKNWGMEIKTNNRLDPKDGEGIRFGVVVTLKEIDGVNRIDEFVKNCVFNGWIVNAIDIKNRIDIHEKINEEIEFS